MYKRQIPYVSIYLSILFIPFFFIRRRIENGVAAAAAESLLALLLAEAGLPDLIQLQKQKLEGKCIEKQINSR